MSIKNDSWIRKMSQEKDMINPFSEKQIKEAILSWGVSSYGYDMRLSHEFKVLKKEIGEDALFDPKCIDKDLFYDTKDDFCIIPPNSFVLGKSIEYFRIPRSILVICTGKSSYARCGIIVNLTPFEPTWEGTATISISNTSPIPVKIYAGEGIAQLIFIESEEICESAYIDRKGKYNFQKTITLSK